MPKPSQSPMSVFRLLPGLALMAYAPHVAAQSLVYPAPRPAPAPAQIQSRPVAPLAAPAPIPAKAVPAAKTVPDKVAPAKPAAAAPESGVQFAVLQGTNKVTARSTRLETPIGTLVRFGNLEIVAQKCETIASPSRAQGEQAALLDIWELKPSERPQQIFYGWMYASSPSLSSLAHPVYDVTLLECTHKNGGLQEESDDTVEKTAVEKPAAEKPSTEKAEPEKPVKAEKSPGVIKPILPPKTVPTKPAQ